MSDEQPSLPTNLNLDPKLAPRPDARSSSPEVTPLSAEPGSTSEGCLKTGLTFTFRLLLLGVGVTLAWLLGIVVAQWLPSPSARPPLQEVTLRKTNRVLTEIRRLPGRWQEPTVEQTRIEPVPIPTEPVEPLTAPAQVLSDREKQVLEEDLAAIQADLKTLSNRLVDIETRLGRSQSTASVESRLAALRDSLNGANGEEESPEPESAVSPPDDGAAAEAQELPTSLTQEPLLQVNDLQVTLPSDALFVPGEARLLETAPLILNTILIDLSRYPEATIVIGSHTDDRLEVGTSRELALKQANALQAYLAANLQNQPEWVTVGYGQSQPLTDNRSPEARQRNRRIEILVNR